MSQDGLPGRGFERAPESSPLTFPGLPETVAARARELAEPVSESVDAPSPLLGKRDLTGEEVRIRLFVLNQPGRSAGRAVSAQVAMSYSAPFDKIFGEGPDGLGEWCISAGTALVFSRGNIGAWVNAEADGVDLEAVARALDEVLAAEKSVEPDALTRRLPKVSDVELNADAVEVGVPVIATARATTVGGEPLQIAGYFGAGMVVEAARAGAWTLRFPAEGPTRIVAYAVDPTTLLVGHAALDLEVGPARP